MKQKDFYLKTARLLLRPYSLEDEEAIFEVINDQKVYETTLYIPYPYPRQYVTTWIRYTEENWTYERGFEWAIINLETQKYIGNVGIVNHDVFNNSGEITYFIGSKYSGQGYATEAVSALLKWGIETMGLERILGRCIMSNVASKRVMEKCGFTYEGIGRHEAFKEGRYIDLIRLAILREDYYKGE